MRKKCVQNSVRMHVKFWVGLDAHKFSKDSCGKFSTNFSEDSRQPLVVLDAKIWSWLAYSKTVTKKDSVVLLVAKTLSIRGSLYIWYSLQITLRLRGATPTNRHPLQSCGFSREILWHSCLEVVMNMFFNGKCAESNIYAYQISKYFVCGFVLKSTTKPYQVVITH